MEGDQAVPMDEEPGVVPEHLVHVSDVQVRPRLPKKPLAQPDKPEDRRNVQGDAKAVDDLDDRLVQAEGHPDDEAQEGGRAPDGEKAARAADGQGQGDLLGSDALGQLVHNGIHDASLPK